jgi:putative transposase
VLGVPVSTHYARRSRKPSRRVLADRGLLVDIESAAAAIGGSTVRARPGWSCAGAASTSAATKSRVSCASTGSGKLRGRKKRTTIPDEAMIDRLATCCTATSPPAARTRIGSATSPTCTWNGFLYLAFVLDCYSRLIVGWQFATPMRTELVLDALEMANGLRRPHEGLIAYSDCGSQYTGIRYTERLDELGAAPSVGSKGDAYDNATAEAWVATFKSELVDGRRFPFFEHAEHEVLHWIGFYNGERLHEALGDLPPAAYEMINYRTDNTPILSAT